MTDLLADGPGRHPPPVLVDLRAELFDQDIALARDARPLVAQAVTVPPGPVAPGVVDGAEVHALMFLEGLMLLELDAGRAHVGWLIGDGDLVNPTAICELAVMDGSRWRALTTTRVAVLDPGFVQRAERSPIVAQMLLAHSTRTASWLLAKSLILSAPRMEDRLLLLFSMLGERWGRMTSAGIMLRLPLTHEMLAALSGARRPSVSLALASLERDGVLTCTSRGAWLLRRNGGRLVAGRG